MLLLSIAVILLLTACSKENDEPNINISAEILNVTDKEFKYIGTEGIDNPSKSDFKTFNFTLDVRNLKKVKNRKIIVPDFETLFNNYKDSLYWFGNSSAQDNKDESFAKYTYNITLYTRRLNEQDLKELLNSKGVIIFWYTNNGQQKEHKYKVGEIINFK